METEFDSTTQVVEDSRQILTSDVINDLLTSVRC